MLRREVRVALRHREVGMPEQLLDRVEVDAAHHELACEVVPQIVRTEVRELGIHH